MPREELMSAAKLMGAPYDLVCRVHEDGCLPVVNFAAGGRQMLCDSQQIPLSTTTPQAANNRRDLGWFGPGQMVREFEDSVKKMSSGRVSNPVKTKFGFHIIKKTGFKE